VAPGRGDDLLNIEMVERAYGATGVDELNDIGRPSDYRTM
jgi:hypothetical protein